MTILTSPFILYRLFIAYLESNFKSKKFSNKLKCVMFKILIIDKKKVTAQILYFKEDYAELISFLNNLNLIC